VTQIESYKLLFALKIAGPDGDNAQLRDREEDKRNHSVVQRLLNGVATRPAFLQRFALSFLMNVLNIYFTLRN